MAIEHRERGARERHDVLFGALHSLRRERPQSAIEVDFGPTRFSGRAQRAITAVAIPVNRRAFRQTVLFPDRELLSAQFGEVAFFAVDLILLEVEVSRSDQKPDRRPRIQTGS